MKAGAGDGAGGAAATDPAAGAGDPAAATDPAAAAADPAGAGAADSAVAATADPVSASLLERLTQALPAMLADLETLVCCESPTSDRAANDRVAELFAELGSRLLGMPAEHLDSGGGRQLRWRFGTGDRVLLLGHLDTVWPLGTLTRLPFTSPTAGSPDPAAST